MSWPAIEGGTPLVWNWHLDIFCRELMAWIRGQSERPNLCINVPPGSMKSTVVSVCLPAWIWLWWPEWTGLFVSGAGDVSIRDSMKCRQLVTSEWYAGFRLPWKLASDQDAKGWFKNTAGGERQATTIGSRGTGKRVHHVIFDDANDTKEVSPAKLDAVWDSYRLTFQNRLKDMTKGGRCNIQQRTHMQDLTGHLMEEDGPQWSRIVIREEWEENDPDAHPDDPRTEPGELFFLARFPPAVVESEKRILGAVGYAGQHQQRPIPKEGAIFRVDRIEIIEVAPVCAKVCRGWDQAASRGRGDYTAGGLLGREKDGGFVILDMARKQTDEPRSLLKSVAMQDGRDIMISWPQDPGAAGKDQARSIVADMAGWIIKTSPETGAKETRWEPFAAQVNGGNVKMVRGPWNRALLEEMETAPNGAHDDQLDALARAFAEVGIEPEPGFHFF